MSTRPKIIHEDDALLVIDKPAGMPSVSLKEGEVGTLASWILQSFPDQIGLDRGVLEAGLIHRLDNETSGVIIAAKTQHIYDLLKAQFDAEEVKKEYVALVLGDPPDNGRITDPIAHHPRKKKKMMVCRTTADSKALKSRPAITEFNLQKRYGSTNATSHRAHYALLSVIIKTGVRHQIRAHLASIGNPIAGDRLYQNPRIRKNDVLDLKRHFLHAKRISFVHPSTGSLVEFSSALPADLSFALRRLKAI